MTEENKKWALPFFSILAAQQLSIIGSRLGGFAIVWWVASKYDSATVLATMSLVQMLPRIIFGPFIGALVDRWDRRKVMIIADSLVAAFSLVLAILFWTDSLQMWHVYVVMVARAIGGTFHWPAMAASTSLMVPKEHLGRVAGINQTLEGVWSIVAPVLGALFMEIMPLHSIMMIDVGTAFLAVMPLFFITIPQLKRATGDPALQSATFGEMVRALFQDVKAGFAYAWQWTGLRAIMILATVVNMVLTPAFSLLPMLIKNHFGGGATELGWVESAFGLGIIAGGLLLSVWGGFKRKMMTSMMGLIGMGVGCIAMGLAPGTALWMAISAGVLMGVMNPIANGPIHAIMQSVVEPEMQGRVLTTLGSAAGFMSLFSMAIAGPLSDKVGIMTWFLVGGVICIVMSVISILTPSVMNIEDQKQSETKQTEVAAASLEPT